MKSSSITFMTNSGKKNLRKSLKDEYGRRNRPVPESATGCSKMRAIFGNEKRKTIKNIDLPDLVQIIKPLSLQYSCYQQDAVTFSHKKVHCYFLPK